MARYKTLRSVAHNFGHSFTSLMNYRDGDYVMGHLLRQARKAQMPKLTVDLLTGSCEPAELCVGAVRASIDWYLNWFPELVAQHDSSLALIQSARMTVKFDLARERSSPGASVETGSPYTALVEIRDDRGKCWSAEFSGWWVPEPQPKGLRERVRRMAARFRIGLS